MFRRVKLSYLVWLFFYVWSVEKIKNWIFISGQSWIFLVRILVRLKMLIRFIALVRTLKLCLFYCKFYAWTCSFVSVVSITHGADLAWCCGVNADFTGKPTCRRLSWTGFSALDSIYKKLFWTLCFTMILFTTDACAY